MVFLIALKNMKEQYFSYEYATVVLYHMLGRKYLTYPAYKCAQMEFYQSSSAHAYSSNFFRGHFLRTSSSNIKTMEKKFKL